MPERDFAHQTCTHTNGSRFTVVNFGKTANAVRWGSATIEDLVGWLIDAQGALDRYNFGYDKDIKVAIEQMSGLGYVTTGVFEGRRTLHLNEDNSIAVEIMKNTSVREYFHHAQGHARTKVGTGTLLIDRGAEERWMIEGSARWFEDDPYDSDNSYLENETQGNLRRLRQFRSIVPLTESTGAAGNGPDGPATATSRFNDILRIGCNSARICSLAGYDASKLVQRGLSATTADTDGPSPMRTRSTRPEIGTDGVPGMAVPRTTYDACREELQTATEKLGEDVSWSCNADGTKRWH